MYYLSVFLFISYVFGLLIYPYTNINTYLLLIILLFLIWSVLLTKSFISFILLNLLMIFFSLFLKSHTPKEYTGHIKQKYMFIECTVSNIPKSISDDNLFFKCDVINSDISSLIGKRISVITKKEDYILHHSRLAFIARKSVYENKIFLFPLENFFLVDNSQNRIFEYLYRIRNKLIENYSSNTLSQNSFSLGMALIFGDKREIESSIKEIFIKTGLIHLLVISGMHVAILISAVMFIFSFLPKRIRVFIPVIVLPVYTFLTGLNIPVIRASVMGFLYSFSKIVYFRPDPLVILFWTGLAILIFSPDDIYSPSFQLSFLATLGILLFIRDLSKNISFKEKYILYPVFLSTVSLSFIAPLLILYFGGFSLSGIVLTLLFLPLLFLYILLSTFNLLSFFLIKPAVLIMDILGEGIINSVKFLNHFSLYLTHFQINYVSLFLYYISVIVILLVKRTHLFKIFLIITVFSIFLSFSKKEENTIHIHTYKHRWKPDILVKTPFDECIFSLSRDNRSLFRALKKMSCYREYFFSQEFYLDDLFIKRYKNGFLIKTDQFKIFLKNKNLKMDILYTKKVYQSKENS